jgi:hypothetical protein
MDSLYLVENVGVEVVVPPTRCLFEVENVGRETVPGTPPRHLFELEDVDDGEIYPWLERIAPKIALPGEQIMVYGDGFGAAPATFSGIGEFESEQMGEAVWSARSPGLWPANGGVPTSPALALIVPFDAENGGLITVLETS